MADRSAVERLVHKDAQAIAQRVAHGQRPPTGALAALRRDLKPLEPSWFRRWKATRAVAKAIKPVRKANRKQAKATANWSSDLELGAGVLEIIIQVIVEALW